MKEDSILLLYLIERDNKSFIVHNKSLSKGIPSWYLLCFDIFMILQAVQRTGYESDGTLAIKY